MMHEFNKCRFCMHYDPLNKRYDKCNNVRPCYTFELFDLNVIKVIDKAKLYGISVTDVINLIREASK